MAAKIIDLTTQHPGWIGDQFPIAFAKVNDNFEEIYALAIPTQIGGFACEYVGASSFRVGVGYAWVPSLQRLLRLEASRTLSTSGLAANTWGHLYLYEASGVASIELSATAPAAPYAGYARTKSGDTSRRYVGSVRVDAGSVLRNFQQVGNKVFWRVNVGTFSRVLANGAASSATNVSLGIAAPPTATAISARFINNDPGISYVVANADFPAGAFAFQVNPSSSLGMEMVCTSAASISYWYLGSVSGGAFIDVISYTFER